MGKRRLRIEVKIVKANSESSMVLGPDKDDPSKPPPTERDYARAELALLMLAGVKVPRSAVDKLFKFTEGE